MHRMLLGLAAGIAAFAIAAPALADGGGRSSGGQASANGGFFIVSGPGGGFGDGHGDRRRHHDGDGGVWINGGEWALYNNRPFQPDSFNGWWHDRPDRAYPAWMRNNQDCARPWFQGNTLRC